MTIGNGCSALWLRLSLLEELHFSLKWSCYPVWGGGGVRHRALFPSHCLPIGLAGGGSPALLSKTFSPCAGTMRAPISSSSQFCAFAINCVHYSFRSRRATVSRSQRCTSFPCSSALRPHGQWRRYTRTHVSPYAVIGNGCSSLAAPLPLGRAALQLKVMLLFCPYVACY
uniref:Uncharacterized protein n=1 Tax=Knipowitschia caucasica TaxID=637954 RepID=A0AAV2JJL5_KNICA